MNPEKPPRPWSADITFKRGGADDGKCYTTRSDLTHDNIVGTSYKTCLGQSGDIRNPPNTPTSSASSSHRRPVCSSVQPQIPARQPIIGDGRCIRLRTISHSVPPLGTWNPLTERHPGSAFEVVSTSSSRTCTPEQSTERAELCVSRPEFEYNNPISKPTPIRRCGSIKLYPQISEESKLTPSTEELTLPDRLFQEQLRAEHQKLVADNCRPDDLDDPSLTLPDKIFRAHLAKQAEAAEVDVKPKIISKTGGRDGFRSGLKDKFVLNIIENVRDKTDVVSALSNMKLDSGSSTESRSACHKKKRSFGALKKKWSSIVNLAVGVPPEVSAAAAHAKSEGAKNRALRDTTNATPTPDEKSAGSLAGDQGMVFHDQKPDVPSFPDQSGGMYKGGGVLFGGGNFRADEKEFSGSLYTSLAYKSRSSACIAAL